MRPVQVYTSATFIMYLALTSTAQAVTQYTKDTGFGFITNPLLLRASIQMPVTDQVELLEIPKKKLALRVKKGTEEGEIEPLKIYVPQSAAEAKLMADELAVPGKEAELLQSFLAKYTALSAEDKKEAKAKITLDETDFNNIRTEQLQMILSKSHHAVTINGQPLKNNPQLRQTLLKQLVNFFDVGERKKLLKKMTLGETLHLETDLLPDFARKMVRKFLVYRGPNCFHAALAFQGSRFTKSPYYNVKEEKGYHRAMINYDELWRTLTHNFYEVDPRASDLQYGDVLVYFDVPGNLSSYGTTNFRWIRHTATYLFGPYTFSKGSKSSSTPYTVKTMEEEWKTWKGYTNLLGVKVYRRTAKNIHKIPPFDLTDWIY